jgi:hypothetical protein
LIGKTSDLAHFAGKWGFSVYGNTRNLAYFVGKSLMTKMTKTQDYHKWSLQVAETQDGRRRKKMGKKKKSKPSVVKSI